MSVQKALQQYFNQVKHSSDIILEETNDWQTIKKYISDRFAQINLTPKQQEKLDRYNFIYSQLSSKRYTESEVIAQLMKLKKYDLSQSQAVADIQATKEIFTVAYDINKQFEIKMLLDFNWEQMQAAAKAENWVAYAVIEKNRVKLLSMLPDKEDTSAEMFEPHTIIVDFNPALIGAPPIEDLKEFLKEINARHKVNIDTSYFEEAEIIPNGKN